jgi:hypothetical protein
MSTRSALLSRREWLRAATVAGVAVGCPALLGWTSPPSAGTGAGPVMVIRHAEKPAKSATSDGIDLRGRPDSHSLTRQGWTRAAYLPELFTPSPTTGSGTGSRLPQPRTIYASGPGQGDGEGTRSRETVGPLAAALGVPVNTRFSRGQETQLARAAATSPGPVLICWQHGAIPAIGAAFTPAAPGSWPDETYDQVWMFTPAAGGWRFDQLGQELLPGDRS